MNVSQYAESEYLNAELALKKVAREFQVMSDAKEEETKFGKRLTLDIDYGGSAKKFQPSRDSVKTMCDSAGVESKGWVGKRFTFQVVKVNSKDRVIVTGLAK